MTAPTIRRIPLPEGPRHCEYQYEITNPGAEELWLGDIELFRAGSLEELGLDAADCRLFRSGRHKNDMPSVARFGQMDDCMRDAMGSPTESGDGADTTQGQHLIVSDHLTILGSGENYCVLTFEGGREQLFRTEIAVDDAGCFAGLRAVAEFNRYLQPGETLLTETLRVTRTGSPEEAIAAFADRKARRYGARNSRPRSVFCTWYYYGLTVTQEDVLTNLERMQALKLPFDVFQIDEGWERTLGDWAPNEKFPLPMSELARRIREAGYEPGIWTSPFVAKETAPVWQEHPEWILRDKAGQPCIFPMNDTTYYVFDITHPGTLPYFTALYRRLTFDWGYTYHKLDFTRAAVIYPGADFHDKHVTLAQAYFRAVSAIRQGMGEEAYFLMCGGLYDPIIGLVDAQRSGSDVLSMWSSTINKGGKTAPYTIKQSLLRYYMNRWWHNDPDALMVRRNDTMERGLRLTLGLLNDDEARTVTVNQLIGGGIICSTEPLDRIDPDRRDLLRHVLPLLPAQVQPLHLMDGGRFPDRVRITFPDRVLIAQINWSDTKSMPAAVTLDEATLGFVPDPRARWLVSGFFSGQWQAFAAPGQSVTTGMIPPHGAEVIKIERITGEPVIAASTGHFSMGLELNQLNIVGSSLCLSCRQPFETPVTYTVFLPIPEATVTVTLPKGDHMCLLPLPGME